MPGLSPIKILGNLKFFSASLKLPTQGKADPAKEAWASKYHKDRDKADMGGAPEVIPPWFTPREAGFKPHQKSCDKIGQNFKDFHDAMIDAVQYSHNMWKLQAKFKDLQVMAVCAIGSPGSLDGPELESNIKNAPMGGACSGSCVACRVWRSMQQGRRVRGKGPIPTFAPPFVPVGPVVGGDNIAAPGHLMA